MKIVKLINSVEEMTDPRRTIYGYLLHKFVDIVVIGLITLICGGKDFKDMEVLGKAKEEWLKTFLELPNGIPDSDTFRRLFERINPEELSECLNNWITSGKSLCPKTIGIDGKTIRGSGSDEHKPYHVVSAWADEQGIVLGQVTVDEKSNEIKAIPDLLKLFDIKNSVVTIDAMGCQKVIAELIIKQGADYCLALKANQKSFTRKLWNCLKNQTKVTGIY